MRNKANSSIADFGFPERHRATGVRLRRSCRIADWGQPCGRRADRAKRSQFGDGCLASEGEFCRTKPNLGRMGHLGDGAPARGQLCETNPICRSGPRWAQAEGTSLAGPSLALIAPNKPNLPSSETKGKCFGGKELWWIAPTRGPRKTKPISAGTAGAKGRQACWRCRWGRLYKQTQFAMVQEVHHRGTEITEVMLNSWTDLRLRSFSVFSVPLW